MNSEECTICTDPLADLLITMLDCGHVFHTVCIRRYLASLRAEDRQKARRGEAPRDAPELPCPYCRKGASAETIDSLSLERRKIHFECVLKRVWSEDPDAEVRVVLEGPEEVYRTDRMKIADLPRHPDRNNRAFLITDLEIAIGNPRQRFETWVEAANTRSRISKLYSVGTTALDHVSEDEWEREAEQFVVEQPQPEQPTRRTIRGRRPLDIAERNRKERLRLLRTYNTRQRQVDTANRILERALQAVDNARNRLNSSKRRLSDALNSLRGFNADNY